MVILFWASLLLVFYAYAGYPMLLWVIARFKQQGKQEGPAEQDVYSPAVTLVISAYNEEAVIEQKILNSLALNYPRNLLEIVVVSDGSRDRTDEIVDRYAWLRVFLKRFEGRIGKTACLNRTLPFVSGEIVVFSDANSQYDRNAVRVLVRHFIDPTVGFVTGSTRYIQDGESGMADSIGIYTRIEQITKRLESGLSSCVGADGALFAVRRSLIPELRSVDINDLVIPLNIVKGGLRGVFEHRAFCVERTSPVPGGEFGRQVRITSRTIRALVHYWELFNPIRFGMFSFQLFSHKVCKLIVPFLLLFLLGSNAMLLARGPVYAVIFSAQIVLYLLSLQDRTGARGLGLQRLVPMIHAFVTVNAAILQGWLKYLQGETYTVWKTAR